MPGSLNQKIRVVEVKVILEVRFQGELPHLIEDAYLKYYLISVFARIFTVQNTKWFSNGRQTGN